MNYFIHHIINYYSALFRLTPISQILLLIQSPKTNTAKALVTTIELNKEIEIPINKVVPNPFTADVPKNIKIKQVIIVEIFKLLKINTTKDEE